jgi:signal transduction histidine kinase
MGTALRSEILTGVAHEISNISMALQGLFGRLNRDLATLSPAQQDLLRRALRQTADLHTLSENLNLLIVLDRRGVSEAQDPVVLRDLLMRVLQRLRTTHFDATVDVDLDCPPNLEIRALASPERVFLNLLDHVVRGSRGPRLLKIRARSDDDSVEITILGGTPPDEEALTEMFRRESLTRTWSHTAFNLVTAGELIERSGGMVEARIVHQGETPLLEVKVTLRRSSWPGS